ncbi:uncharacterized protein [Physcomitrium patens]|uniref:uncharacterized protein n=1 Tax=Physcomitrium patens TaxID=3218 RepID=UPI003CCD63F7
MTVGNLELGFRKGYRQQDNDTQFSCSLSDGGRRRKFNNGEAASHESSGSGEGGKNQILGARQRVAGPERLTATPSIRRPIHLTKFIRSRAQRHASRGDRDQRAKGHGRCCHFQCAISTIACSPITGLYN